MSFISFCKKIVATGRLAILTQFEYRLNFIADAMVQPLVAGGIEVVLWWAIFKGSGSTEIGGFGPHMYLSYALWAAFFSRLATSWMYEYMMIDEIDSGRINAILTRPVAFYEFYLGQLMGYKLLCLVFSMFIPLGICLFVDLPVILWRFPIALLLVLFYLVFVHSVSYLVASVAFFYNRIHSMTAAKNIAIWIFSGELFPLDLVPEPYRAYLIALPFSSAVYLPVGYLTGRIEWPAMSMGFVSVSIGALVVGLVGHAVFLAGRRVYAGTGA